MKKLKIAREILDYETAGLGESLLSIDSFSVPKSTTKYDIHRILSEYNVLTFKGLQPFGNFLFFLIVSLPLLEISESFSFLIALIEILALFGRTIVLLG
jgi:hypothetical protein